MNRGLLHLLLCLVLAFTGTPAWAHCRPENRVGGSPVFSSNFTLADNAQPVAVSGENEGCGYDFASGVHKYLYGADNPVNEVDPSGHDGDLATEEAEEVDDSIIDNAIIAGEAQLVRQAQQQLVSALIKSIAATLPLVFIPGDKPVTAPPKDGLGEYLFIWHELDAKDKYGSPVRYRKPALSPSQFRNDPDKDPDGVSNFEFPGLPGEKPYLVGFLLLIETPGMRVPNVSKGNVLGIPQVEATYTEPPFYHWSIQGINGCSREQTKTDLSNYAKQVPIIKNPLFPQYSQVDEP